MGKVRKYFITGLIVFVLSAVAAILIFMALWLPELFMMLIGSPFWLMVLFAVSLIAIPLMCIIMGWTFTKVGGFRRNVYRPKPVWYNPGPLVRPR
jgi:hypothetical protein